VGAGEQSFECPACSQPLAAAQVFSAAALRGCAAPSPGAAAASTSSSLPGGAGVGNGHLGAPGWALPGSSGAGAGAGVGLSAWQTSAKIEFLLRLLGELRDRNVAAAQRCGAGPQLVCGCDIFRVFQL